MRNAAPPLFHYASTAGAERFGNNNLPYQGVQPAGGQLHCLSNRRLWSKMRFQGFLGAQARRMEITWSMAVLDRWKAVSDTRCDTKRGQNELAPPYHPCPRHLARTCLSCHGAVSGNVRQCGWYGSRYGSSVRSHRSFQVTGANLRRRQEPQGFLPFGYGVPCALPLRSTPPGGGFCCLPDGPLGGTLGALRPLISSAVNWQSRLRS